MRHITRKIFSTFGWSIPIGKDSNKIVRYFESLYIEGPFYMDSRNRLLVCIDSTNEKSWSTANMYKPNTEARDKDEVGKTGVPEYSPHIWGDPDCVPSFKERRYHDFVTMGMETQEVNYCGGPRHNRHFFRKTDFPLPSSQKDIEGTWLFLANHAHFSKLHPANDNDTLVVWQKELVRGVSFNEDYIVMVKFTDNIKDASKHFKITREHFAYSFQDENKFKEQKSEKYWPAYDHQKTERIIL